MPSRSGLALGCKIARHTKWDRKSYYYPDLPKNYQISQYDLPLCYEGEFELVRKDGSTLKIRIRRAHLEEDAGKLLHEAPGGYAIDFSIVDLNRAGTPLLEIVTEPDFSSPQDVALFGQELQKLVQFLGVSQGQMQMGHMRFEPNINVHITDQDGKVHKTAITEIKNLNSFSVLERATAYEVQRQIRQWEETGSLGRKSTYGWDEASGTTFLQREKEEANDYRYFPDPDLVPVEVDEAWLAELKAQIGELPAARRKRYVEALGLSATDAAMLAGDRATGEFYEAAIAAGGDAKRIGQSDPFARPANGQRKERRLARSASRPAPLRRGREVDRSEQNLRQQRRRDFRQAARSGRPGREIGRGAGIDAGERHRRDRCRDRRGHRGKSQAAAGLPGRQTNGDGGAGGHGDEERKGIESEDGAGSAEA